MIHEADFKFCPKCGGNLKKEKENLLICTKCNLHYYINPRPCTGIILFNKQKEIMLVKRKYPPQKDMWDIPGGFIDLNESAEESMKRELAEELHLLLDNIRYLTSYHDRYEYKGLYYYTLNLVFTGELQNEQIQPADDVSGYAFFPVSQMPLQEIAFDGLRKTLEKLYSFK